MDHFLRRKASFPILFPGIGFILSVLIFYPGWMTPDSWVAFGQSLSFEFNDWHPPFLAFTWSLMNVIVEGPQPMLFMQLGFYWTGVYFLLKSLPKERPWFVSVGIGVLLLSPRMLAYLGVIWKDVLLASIWIFALAFTFNKRYKQEELSRESKIWLSLLVLCGALLRWNTLAVFGPLILYIWLGSPFAKKILITLGLYVLIGLSGIGIEWTFKKAINASESRVTDSLFLVDLIAIAVQNDQKVFPFEVSDPEMEEIKKFYKHAGIIDPGCDGFLYLVDRAWQQDSRSLKSAWISAVENHPIDYMAGRMDSFWALLTKPRDHWIKGIHVGNPGDWWAAPNDRGLKERINSFNFLLREYVVATAHNPFLQPLTWFLLAWVLVVLAMMNLTERPVREFMMVCGVSAILTLSTYLIVGIGTDFRYSQFTIIATTFGLCALLGNLNVMKKREEVTFPKEI